MPTPAEAKSAGAIPETHGNPAEGLWNAIIRPPRTKYKMQQLGPTHFGFEKRAFARRTDTQLRNARGLNLECSFFEPLPKDAWEKSLSQSSPAAIKGVCRPQGSQYDAGNFALQGGRTSSKPPPCIVFLHGNSSCRLEALPLLQVLIPLSISLFCFDFAGCGLSEGEYISLGWFERDDLALCIDFLRSSGKASQISIWGRSMGAFTALLHADRDPSIAGLVLDSPFTSLSLLVEELARNHAKVPAWMVRAVLVPVRSIILHKAGFDIDKLQALEHVSQSFSPALFIAASGDTFILPHHTQDLYDAYPGEKEICMIDGDHNSLRPEACRHRATLFLCQTFHDARIDGILKMHNCGLYDVFSLQPQTGSFDDRPAWSFNDLDEDGRHLAQRMHVFTQMQNMVLMEKRKCYRPFVATTTMRLCQETSEAGFFVLLEPASTAQCFESCPHMIVITFSASAIMVSRVCDDSLETVSAARGLPSDVVHDISLKMVGNRMTLNAKRIGHEHAESRPLLEFQCEGIFRGQLKLWLMLLSGRTAFGPIAIEDGEATIRENLGDTVLKSRHLGTSVDSLPAQQPRGDLSLPTGRSGSLSTRRGGDQGCLPTPVSAHVLSVRAPKVKCCHLM